MFYKKQVVNLEIKFSDVNNQINQINVKICTEIYKRTDAWLRQKE